MSTTPELLVLRFETPRAWEEWLEVHHAGSPGVWLELAKKGSGVASVTYAEALDVALCFGWIDGHKRTAGAGFWRQRFTPRTARSKWSKINRAKIDALVAQGRVRPAGLHQVELARADGRWAAAYDSPAGATVPDDLQRALDAAPRAAAFFATIDRANRYAVLYRVQDAKKLETRARRIAQLVAMLDRHEKLHP